MLVVSPAASNLRQVGGFLKSGYCVPRPLRTTSGIRASQVRRGTICWFKDICCWLAEIVCRSRNSV